MSGTHTSPGKTTHLLLKPVQPAKTGNSRVKGNTHLHSSGISRKDPRKTADSVQFSHMGVNTTIPVYNTGFQHLKSTSRVLIHLVMDIGSARRGVVSTRVCILIRISILTIVKVTPRLLILARKLC